MSRLTNPYNLVPLAYHQVPLYATHFPGYTILAHLVQTQTTILGIFRRWQSREHHAPLPQPDKIQELTMSALRFTPAGKLSIFKYKPTFNATNRRKSPSVIVAVSKVLRNSSSSGVIPVTPKKHKGLLILWWWKRGRGRQSVCQKGCDDIKIFSYWGYILQKYDDILYWGNVQQKKWKERKDVLPVIVVAWCLGLVFVLVNIAWFT